MVLALSQEKTNHLSNMNTATQTPRVGRSESNFGMVDNEEKCIVVDIETVPNEDAGEFFNEASVKLGNLKDEEKIAAKVKEAKAKFVANAALSPVLGRIVSIGFLGRGFTTPKIITARKPEDEDKLIREFLHVVSATPGTPIAMYNGLGFDLPFIYHRARVRNLSEARTYPFGQCRNRIVDVYKEYTFWLYKDTVGTFFPSASLSSMAESIGARHPKRDTECDSADYGKMVLSDESSDVNRAHDHLIADLYETLELYNRL